MLEWMHDATVVKNLQANFLDKTMQDCLDFIKAAQDVSLNMHLAITNDSDTYMGTVSLKNITGTDAEFAITIRNCAMGQGYSAYAMREIIQIGLQELGLDTVYWYVHPDNQRAVRFYDKNGYSRMNILTAEGIAKNTGLENKADYIWYCVKKADWQQ